MHPQLLKLLGRWVVGHPIQVVAAYVIAAAASLWGAVKHLDFKTDQNDLVAADVEYNRRYLDFLAEFADLEFLYVVIQVEGDPERAVRVADAVVEELEPLRTQGQVKSVYHRVPREALGYGLLFQDRDYLESLASWLAENRPRLEELAKVDGFASLLRFLAESFDDERVAAAAADGGEGERQLAEWGFRLLDVNLSAMEAALRGEAVEPLERLVDRAAGLTLRERGYLATEGERFLLVEILPAKDTTTLELIREPLAAIRAALDRVRSRFPGVKLGLTGRPVLQADEMETTNRDMTHATVIALAGVFVLCVAVFRRLLRPALAMLTLAVSVLLTFGFVSVAVSYLTLLSIVFAAMLVGLGIDFGIHFLARYQEEIAAGRSVREAIEVTLTTTGVGIGTGAVTTAAAFFTALLIDFKGLRELGLIAAIGVLLCFLAMLTLLPAMLLLIDGRVRDVERLRRIPPPRVPLVERASRRPVEALVILGVLTLLGLSGLLRIRSGRDIYSSNLLELQARGLESIEYENLLNYESDHATWYAAFITRSLEEARRTVDRLEPLKAQGIVGAIDSPFDVVPDLAEQEAKREVLARAAQAVTDLAFAAPAANVDPAALRAACEALLARVYDFQDLLVPREDSESRETLRRLSALTERLERISERLGDDPQGSLARLEPLQARWFGELAAVLEKLRGALRLGPITPQTLPPALRDRYVSKDGAKYLVYAYPRKDIWDEDNMEEFIAATRAIDENVTGTPVQVYESSWRMRDGFVKAGLYSFAVVFLLILVDLRSVVKTLLAMVPLFFGLFWLVETIPIAGLKFNLANFFAVPILIGTGVDGGVHVLHRFREIRSSAEVGRTTCAAVTVSLLTTMVGFGSMAFASHRGVASLGWTMFAGLFFLLVASVVLLPSLLALGERLSARRAEKARRSRVRSVEK